jgi:hypothetical protein
MNKPNKQQQEKIIKKQEQVEIAQLALNNYLEGVADNCNLDPKKKWNYDFKTGEFKEVKENV